MPHVGKKKEALYFYFCSYTKIYSASYETSKTMDGNEFKFKISVFTYEFSVSVASI